jgi:hypothetical protein
MFGHTYYHGVIRKYVALFGTLFNDVYVNRYDSKSDMTQSVKVPINYGPREKVLARVVSDPELNKMPAIQLPRMTFEITNMSYASSRKLNTLGKRYKQDTTDANKLLYQYNPVPYDISFTLSVIVKNADDGANIIEQILPFFTPEWTTTVHIIPEMDITVDIPVVLNSVEVQDDYEGNFETRRSLIWTLNFTMKAYVFGPVRKSSIIKFANTNIYDTTSAPNTHLSSVDVRPGLTANGTPTSDAELTISLNEIESIDDYGYIKTVTNPNL